MQFATEKPDGSERGVGETVLQAARVLVKRKKLIIGMCVVTALLSAAVSMMLPKTYSATARVLPPQDQASGISALISQMGGLAALAGGGKSGGDADLYVGILNSRSLADAVIERLHLVNVYKVTNRDRLRERLHAFVDVQAGKDGIISITAQDADPARAALIANTYVDELGRISVKLNLVKAGSDKYFFEKRLDITKRDLKNAEDDLRAFCERNKIVQPEAQASAALGGIAALKANIATSEVQLAVLRRSNTEESPEVKSLVAALAKMKQDVARMVAASGDGDGVPALGRVPEVGLAYARKLREVRLQEAIFEQLTKQYEVAKLSDARDTSSLQVLDAAVVPEVRSKPKRGIIVILSTLAALAVSVLLAYALEFYETMPDEQRGHLLDLKRDMLSFR